MRLQHKIGPLKVLNEHLNVYPTPINLSYAYNFGSLAGFLLISQMLTGILLAMHYVSNVDLAFNSVVHIMNDVPSGIILRYAHANGASLFFIVVYIHILRGLYYGSGNQPRELVWLTGIIILLVMVITAFIGYVLPWGQMSFWGATVITSLATVLPIIGKNVVTWLWGGFSVDNPTLNRFYSLHYTLPFILAGLSIFHIAALHQYGSTNPIAVNTQSSTVPFSTYFGLKDLLGLIALLLILAILVFFYPEVLGHPDNLIPANPYATPLHIIPEWYFLWFYTILRSIPNKAMGVIAIAITFISLIIMPFISATHIGSAKLRILSDRLYWGFLGIIGLLTWDGSAEIMAPTIFLGQISTITLLVYIVLIFPIIPFFESNLYLYGNTKL